MKKFTAFKIRTIQFFLRIASVFILTPKQEIFKEESSLPSLASILKGRARKVMFLVGPNIAKRGYQEKIRAELEKIGISTCLFISSSNEPDVDMVNKAYCFYKENGCDSIFAIGGGSIIDLAKAIKSIHKDIDSSFGLLRARKSKMVLVCCPTTAGTGSEATFVSVIKDSNHIKRTIISPYILPNYVYFDSSFLSSLPKSVALYSGLDAFTHDIESYISRSSSHKSRKFARESLLLFKKSFATFMLSREDKEATLDMLMASFLAGKSFTRAYIGYAHSLGHALGSEYNLPHGLAVISCLEEVLHFYRGHYKKRKKELERVLGCPDLEKYISSLKKEFEVNHLDLKIGKLEAEKLAQIAYNESCPLYPVPRLACKEELASLIREIGGKNED